MLRAIESFHYLTQDMPHRTHEEQVLVACKAGVKWIQLRVKEKSFEEWLAIALRVKKITAEFDVTLIINDNIAITKEVNADGVHLGQHDETWQEARKILGGEKIIGYSTHSFEELMAARNFDVDYFGLGPFQFTSTKETFYPVLGLGGTEMIISRVRESVKNKPIIVIGGVQLSDVAAILKTGADGVAVSSAVNHSPVPGKSAKEFLNSILVEQMALNQYPITING